MTTKTYGATGTGSSGQIQYFTAGTAGTYQITAAGAQGGNGAGNAGGLGATASGDIYLAKGAKLEIVVGQQGANGEYGAGGGGGSFVIEYDNATSAYDIDEVIAGGGGGGASHGVGGGGTTKGSGIAGQGGGTGGGIGPTVGGGGGGGGGRTGGAGAGPGNAGGNGSNAGTTFDGGPAGSGGGDGGLGGGGGGGFSGGGGGGGYGGGNGNASGGGGGGGGSYVNPDATSATQTANDNTSEGFVRIAMVCFVTGTRIRTVRGEIPVEHLAVGERVITASGALRSIRWIGQRTIDCRRHPNPHDAYPIRIGAQAFGPNQPARELFLSPGHPVLVGADVDGEDGHLVPIMCLINGTTVRRVAVDTVTYWHVELDEHDILLAENLPAESYIDLGSRPWFAGANGALYDPDMAATDMPGRCRPVAIHGPIVEAERRRLDTVFAAGLASHCCWPAADEMSIGL